MEKYTRQQLPATQSGAGIAGMVLGIIAFVTSFVPCVSLVSLSPAVSGLVCSIVALATARAEHARRGMAIAGLILCALTLLWIPIFLTLFMGGVGAAFAALIASFSGFL